MSQGARAETGPGMPQQTPAELLVKMGVLDPRKVSMEMRSLPTRPFTWVNMATLDVPMGPTLNAIKESGVANPPRSGHLGGTWSRIAQGAGGSVSLNQVVRQEGVGYPLILDINQTPTTDGKSGDTLYYPGSIFTPEGETDLPFYTVDGQAVDRSQPRWTPLVMTPVDGELVPLTTVHRQDMQSNGVTDAKFVSDVMVERETDVRMMFDQMLSRAEMEDDLGAQQHLLTLISNRAVTRDGLVEDRRLMLGRDGYRVGGKTFSRNELVDQLLLPFQVASNPEILKTADITEMPHVSKEMLIVLMAALNTDFYNGRESMTPVNPHLHWGAFQMAGAPPMQDGYFSGSASGVKTLMQVLRADLADQIPPVYYVLMPAAPFTLWASEGDPAGQEMMAHLVSRVHEETDHLKGKPDPMKQGVARAVSGWMDDMGAELPPYLRSRFSSYDTPRTKASPPTPAMVKPPGYDELTFRQASMLVGTLMKEVQ